MTAYYNEFDPFAAAWLRELIKAGHIAPGDVDERPIQEVKPDELKGYTQCHFFAGIGGWSLALRLAGWVDNRSVWTGSCPCQPFSSAGRQKGKADERHLWPIWSRLIAECRPPVIFGEQVAAAVAHGWLDDVSDDLEREGYAVGAAVLPACSVGRPHKRDRLWFVADRAGTGLEGGAGASLQRRGVGFTCGGFMGHAQHNGQPTVSESGSEGQAIQYDTQGEDSTSQSARAGSAEHVADTQCEQTHQEQQRPAENEGGRSADVFGGRRSYCEQGYVADALSPRLEGHGGYDAQYGSPRRQESPGHAGAADVRWLVCPDGKARPVEPSIRLLVNGVLNRVGKLRGYGNAIVPQVAAEFIKSYRGVA